MDGLQLESLINEPWVFPPVGSPVRDKLVALFRQNGLPLPTNVVEALSIPVVMGLLQRTNMVVALPEGAARLYCKAGLLTVLMRNLPLRVGSFGLMTHRGRSLSAAAQLTLSVLREVAEPLYRVHGPAGPALSQVRL